MVFNRNKVKKEKKQKKDRKEEIKKLNPAKVLFLNYVELIEHGDNDIILERMKKGKYELATCAHDGFSVRYIKVDERVLNTYEVTEKELFTNFSWFIPYLVHDIDNPKFKGYTLVGKKVIKCHPIFIIPYFYKTYTIRIEKI